MSILGTSGLPDVVMLGDFSENTFLSGLYGHHQTRNAGNIRDQGGDCHASSRPDFLSRYGDKHSFPREIFQAYELSCYPRLGCIEGAYQTQGRSTH
jgi:hypothetical protein